MGDVSVILRPVLHSTGQVYVIRCNAYRITVNDWRLLYLRKIIDQLLNNSESRTVNLHHCDSIIEGYQYSMSEDRAFESLLLENYSSFILTIECNRSS